MNLPLALLQPGDLWLAVLAIGGWLVFMCLRTFAAQLDHAVRVQRLKIEAEQLRQSQLTRLKSLMTRQ